MAKLFEFDSRKGNLIDKITGDIPTNTAVTIKRTEKGRAANFIASSTSRLLYSTDLSLTGLTAFTVEAWIKPNSTIETYGGIFITTDSVFRIQMAGDYGTPLAPLVVLGSGNYQATVQTMQPDRWYHLLVVYDGSGVSNQDRIKVYQDNVLLSGNYSGTLPSSIPSTTGIGQIGRNSSFDFDGGIAKINLYNTTFTAQERQLAYNEFLKSQTIEAPKNNFVKPYLGINENETSLVDGWDLTKSYVGIKGTTGTPSGGPLLSDNGIYLDGTDDLVSFGDIGNIQEVELIVEPKTTTEELISLDTGKKIHLSGGTITYSGVSEVDTFVNGANTNTMVANQKQHVIMQFAQTDANAFTLGKDGANYANIIVEKLQAKDAVSSSTVAANKWNQIAKHIIFNSNDQTNLNADGKTYTAGMHNENGWYVNSGSFKTAEDATNGKWIECVSAGPISMPSKTAYGTWEFYLYKDLDANVVDVMLIADTKGGAGAAGQDGYGIRFDSDETIALVESVSGTPTDLITTTAKSLQTWYKIKVTRTPSGGFELFVDDTSIGTATDTTTTTSTFIVVDADAGDRIKNLKIIQGVEV